MIHNLYQSMSTSFVHLTRRWSPPMTHCNDPEYTNARLTDPLVDTPTYSRILRPARTCKPTSKPAGPLTSLSTTKTGGLVDIDNLVHLQIGLKSSKKILGSLPENNQDYDSERFQPLTIPVMKVVGSHVGRGSLDDHFDRQRKGIKLVLSDLLYIILSHHVEEGTSFHEGTGGHGVSGVVLTAPPLRKKTSLYEETSGLAVLGVVLTTAPPRKTPLHEGTGGHAVLNVVLTAAPPRNILSDLLSIEGAVSVGCTIELKRGRSWLIGGSRVVGVDITLPSQLSFFLSPSSEEKFSALEDHKLGEYVGPPVSLKIDPLVQPHYLRSRPIPLALADNVTREITSGTGCEAIPRSRSLSSGHHYNIQSPPPLHRGGYLSPSTLATSLPFSGLSEMASTNRAQTIPSDSDMSYTSTDNSDMEADTDGQGTFTMADNLGRKRKFRPRKHTQPKKTALTVTNKFDALKRADNITSTPDDQNTDKQPQTATATTPKIRYPPIVTLGTQNYNKITKLAKEIGTEIKITYVANGLKIHTTNKQEFELVQHLLKDMKQEFHTYTLPRDKPLKVVIKGLPPNMATEDIQQELMGLGFPVTDVRQFSRKTQADNTTQTKLPTQRQGGRGGTAVFIKNNIPHYSHNYNNPQNLEVAAVQVNTKSESILFAAIYKPPTKTLLEHDLNTITDSDTIFLAGDLNSKHTNWNSRLTNRDGRTFNEHAERNNYIVVGPGELTFYPSNPLHRPDIIDVVLTNMRVTSEELTRITLAPGAAPDGEWKCIHLIPNPKKRKSYPNKQLFITLATAGFHWDNRLGQPPSQRVTLVPLSAPDGEWICNQPRCQKPSLDDEEIYDLVVLMVTQKVLLSIAIENNVYLEQLNIKFALLNSPLKF
uniref:(California timema) hypothetical protein n=1 Tax=Timema californicum TaxID=61474 RepID=A0A7R9P6P5_TIMCA|nr:unnamed protein product [Timema californicum]